LINYAGYSAIETPIWSSYSGRILKPTSKEEDMLRNERVLVVGATGGSGRAVIEELLRAGHHVTAFSRHAEKLDQTSARLTTVNGDAMNPDDVDRAVRGHDAVIVTLGIAENPLKVRLFGAGNTPNDVRSTGTRNVIAAMRRHGVRRLVVQTSFGVGETRDNLGWLDRAFFSLLLKPQIADTELQEVDVRGSELDWVLAQPVHLTDDDADEMPFTSTEGEVRQMKIARKRVGRFMARAAWAPEYFGRTVALSG